MKKLIMIFFFCLGPMLRLAAQQQCPIIPLPLHVEKGNGEFTIQKNTPVLVSSPQLEDVASYFQQEMLRLKAIPLAVQQIANAPAIRFELTKASKGEEAYEVVIEPNGISIKGGTVAAVFNGAVSVLQLVSNNKKSAGRVSIGAWKIKDKPQYRWRGLMLDESRYFIGKEKLKSTIDWMAFYKLNRLHWHLTDEPAWRIEIKRYPKLALVGGIGGFNNAALPAKYYTQLEISEIVTYAAKRNITVIPEIDMPGHATAANKAYPEYSGGGSPKLPEFTFDPGNPKTYTYLSNILREVNALFPSKMLHLGGDEVSYGSDKWAENEGIKKLMQEHQLKDIKEVEHYFMQRMADSVYQLNAKMLVWDEMADLNLPKDKTVIFWWRQEKPQQLQTSLQKGYQTVLCPRLPFYFDFVQDSTHTQGRKWGKSYNSVKDVYSFRADKWVKNTKDQKNILGIQANLWTETVTNTNRLDYLLFPRIAALAESAWSENNNDFQQFENRLKTHIMLYREQEIYYYDPFKPESIPEPVFFRGLNNRVLDPLED